MAVTDDVILSKTNDVSTQNIFKTVIVVLYIFKEMCLKGDSHATVWVSSTYVIELLLMKHNMLNKLKIN